MTLLLLLACGRSTVDPAPFAGVLAALDHDHDGRVSAAEYRAGAPPVAPTFAEVDDDGDGALSAAEVAALVLATDPVTYDPALVQRPLGQAAAGPPPPVPPAGAFPPPPVPHSGARASLREALRFEAAELRAKAPDAALPTAAELDAAAASGLSTEPGRSTAARLREAVVAAGLAWPEALR